MKHYFSVDVASEVGVNAAVVFENISFWIEYNRKTGKNERDGSHWMYSTQKDMAAQFDYLTIKQTRTALEKLERSGYIKTGRFNRHGYDRTSWFCLTEKGETICQSGKNDLPKRAKGIDREGATIPDIKSNNKTVKIPSKARIDEIRKICGII